MLATEYGIESYFHDPQYYQQHGWPKLLGFWLGGLLLAGISQRVQEQEARNLIEPETGKTIVIESQRHTFFYVPLKYWPAVMFVLGFVFMFIRERGA